MIERSKQSSAALLILMALCLPAVAQTRMLKADVIAVADGDTITVLDAHRQQHKIRLNGIDAPETGQDFAEFSSQHLASLLLNKYVAVIWSKTDRDGRLLGTVLLGSQNVNLEQVRLGFAWYFRQSGAEVPEIERVQYEAAENEARAAEYGLWQTLHPIPPFEWRAQMKAAKKMTREQ